MHDQPKYIPLRESTFFGDNRSERALPIGTVARGDLRVDSYLYTGRVNNLDGTEFPFPITAGDMKRGKDRYDIYCMPCHSPLGDGNGLIVRRGYKAPPAYTDPRLMAAGVGHFFDVMTNGYGAMPDYSAQVNVMDRWRIAAYIRALQLSQSATVADVPEPERAQLAPSPAINPQLGGAIVTQPKRMANPPDRGQSKQQPPKNKGERK